jgi:hypothetical protein
LVIGSGSGVGKDNRRSEKGNNSNRTSDERRVERGSSELKAFVKGTASGKSVKMHG